MSETYPTYPRKVDFVISYLEGSFRKYLKSDYKRGDLKMAATKKPATKKPAAKKAAAPVKKAAPKIAAKPKVKRTPKAAFMKPMTPSSLLAAVVGAIPLPRTEVVKKVWDYIKKNKLQDEINKRMINADEKLREIFGKAKVSMFELTKIINQHLK